MRLHARHYFISAGVAGGAMLMLLALGCSKREQPPNRAASRGPLGEQVSADRLGVVTRAAGSRMPPPAPMVAAGSAGADVRPALTTSVAIEGGSQNGPPNTLQTQDVVPGAMLVRTGQASVQVDSLELGIARVRDVARRTGAVVANTSMQGGQDEVRSASLELRIPSAHFDDAVNGLAPIGKLESVNVSVEDVGEEFVDVQARMDNAHRLEQRLLNLLATRTGKLSDVLNVERELARVREEIERYEGRLGYLRTRSSVSTLTVNIHEPPPIVATRPGQHPIGEAFVQAWRNFVALSAALIASLGVVIPLGIIAFVAVVVVRRVTTRTAEL